MVIERAIQVRTPARRSHHSLTLCLASAESQDRCVADASRQLGRDGRARRKNLRRPLLEVHTARGPGGGSNVTVATFVVEQAIRGAPGET